MSVPQIAVLLDLDQHIVVADFGLRDVVQPGRERFFFDQCFHVVSSGRSDLLDDAELAADRRECCDGPVELFAVCAALICVRMRACPLGTTGNEKPMT
jgi:hypothetical protein